MRRASPRERLQRAGISSRDAASHFAWLARSLAPFLSRTPELLP
jgi:hypothetical protein